MHAVGFFHEQSRTDRDDYITILWNNIQPGMQGQVNSRQFEKYGHGMIQSLGTTYDYSSIMHYGDKAFSRNGQPTMVPKKKGAQIGQRVGFSKTDIQKINKLYGCPHEGGKPETTVTETRPTDAPDTKTSTKTTSPKILTTSPTPPTPLIPWLKICTNLRGDCDDLRNQATGPTLISTPVTVPSSTCEDLRVDCLLLVSQRYCKMSKTFMKSFCAKSCGFCYKPPPVEGPDGSTVLPPTDDTNAPLISIWRTSARLFFLIVFLHRQ
ncbi:Astacin (Peptidase M12A) [Parelaphostrongylus tenuis]|uniref:Metalloendopeptidase n=1 Tax=Parelaphostrongylus tenuis TaxID=148309 RepID=A0AAD5RAH5_PARTN|nr:Astacin (Peptidase M12A) [Parelaphostrongylus tenuis]